jgi:hypothetical protein
VDTEKLSPDRRAGTDRRTDEPVGPPEPVPCARCGTPTSPSALRVSVAPDGRSRPTAGWAFCGPCGRLFQRAWAGLMAPATPVPPLPAIDVRPYPPVVREHVPRDPAETEPAA